MVARILTTGTLVERLGFNHAQAGMHPRHKESREYMKGYKAGKILLDHTIPVG